MPGPFRRPPKPFSMRRRLLGLSLLAVLGGYTLLIVATALLASQERRDQHRATVASVRQLLLSRRPLPTTLDEISDALARLISPNFLGWVETDQGVPYGAASQIRLFSIPTGVPLTRLPAQRSSLGEVSVLRVGERLLRPSQDCAKHYGHALVLNEIVTLDEREYAERPLRRFEHEWPGRCDGVHHWHRAGDWEAIDARGQRRLAR